LERKLKPPIYVFFYNSKRKFTESNYNDFKVVLQDFLGDWYESAEEQFDGSLPYYVELQRVKKEGKEVKVFIDFNKQAETNKDVLDLSELDTYRGNKKKVDIDILDIRKYLRDYGF
jgi:DNA modification methylase